MRTTTLVLTVTATLAFSSCSESFQDSDPKGFEACSAWSGYTSSGDVVSLVGGGLEVAEIARQSKTPAIRDSVSNLLDDEALAAGNGQQFGLLDRDAFEEACEEQGDFEFTEAE